ncbi:MAG: phosphoribosylaminoimidazolesuccinocarboxamide synthase [Luminiphilus sp.]
MSRVLDINDDFPIRTAEPVHCGKVRAVYWLTPEDSRRLIDERGYNVHPNAELAIMIVSDRLSAFDCIWHGENGLNGVPGKGAVLNAVSKYWFDLFEQAGLARSHVLEAPHPLLWVVQRAQPVRIEAIARQYITGSMWRAYQSGEREFCGVSLPEDLTQDQRLDQLLITPSTKGIMTNLEGVPAADDVNISRQDIERHWQSFGFQQLEDIIQYESLLIAGFNLIAEKLASIGQLFVDTKFEFGYAPNATGELDLIYMDEVGTPDSSRIWDAAAYERGEIRENSKEGFRQALLGSAADPDILLNKDRMVERKAMADSIALPEELLMAVTATYRDIGKAITGSKPSMSDMPRNEITEVLSAELGLL